VVLNRDNIVTCIPIAGQRVGKQIPAKKILDKQSVARSRNNSTNVYSSLLGNNKYANGLAR
jgi:hypothetical protein